MPPLAQIDAAVFDFMNRGMVHPFLDVVMTGLSSTVLWAGAALCYLTWLAWRKDWRTLKICGVILVAVLVVDGLNYQLLKPFFDRLRPCKEDEMVRAIAGCAGIHGFPSNHATNSMAAAVLIRSLLSRRAGTWLIGLAVLIGMSRVYLGVHYPFDIVFGLAWGAIYASAVAVVVKKYSKLA